jgi:hypothetical protein
MIATYGPAVDSGRNVCASALWTNDGIYDINMGAYSGTDALTSIFGGEFQQELLADGCAHLLSLPKVTVSGDAAVATCYQQLVRRQGAGYIIFRQSSTRWEFVRTKAGWKVKIRYTRLLDGSEESQAILARSLESTKPLE